MKSLIINAGSSSIKFKIFDETFAILSHGQLENIGGSAPVLHVHTFEQTYEESLTITTHEEGMKAILETIGKTGAGKDLDAIGHRVVHGGEQYADAVLIDEEVLRTIESLSSLAPLHNPVNLACIKACRASYPHLPQVAAFDTAFHQTMPATNYRYALPLDLYQNYGIRKYGFHGLSHRYVSETAASFLSVEKKASSRMIICHLGNGSSITALCDGVSVNTSMGFTPLDGIPMGTRSGSLDPGIIIHLLEKGSYSLEDIATLLNKRSGLKGVAGHSDMREVLSGYGTRKEDTLAFDMLVSRISEYIGAYMSSLQGCDVIVFTGGIGENAASLRKAVCERLLWAGVELDDGKNTENKQTIISTDSSALTVLRIRTDEEQMIAQETKRLVEKK